MREPKLMALLALASSPFWLQKAIFGAGHGWPLPLAWQPVLHGSRPQLFFPDHRRGEGAALRANFVLFSVIRSGFHLLLPEFCLQVPLYHSLYVTFPENK